MIIATLVSIFLLILSWQWNTIIPTETVIESPHFATWNIIFPAITFCSINRITASVANQLAMEMKRPPTMSASELSRMFRLILHFHGNGNASTEEYNQLHEILQSNGVGVADLMQSVAPKCNDMLLKCVWKGYYERCDSLFQYANTSEGICCSFNYHAITSDFERRSNVYSSEFDELST